MSATWNSDPVERLRQYLRIPSVHPDVDYTDCVTFLKEQASLLGLPVVVHEFATGKPVVVVTWTGLQPELASILLNSHMDVVPVGEEVWTHPPFEAHITEDGWLYARGVQDMKSVGMMYLEAIRNLKQNGVQLKRTVHVSFVPDEEIDGQLGMKLFSESDVFRELNIGFALDESGACPKPNEYYAFNVERTNRRMIVTCKGNTAHGSSLVRGTAGEKIHYIINKFMTYRAEQMEKFEEQGSLEQLGNYTTINLTKLEGGIQLNVLPDILSVGFDIRISPNVCCEEFEKMVDSWCAEAGDEVTYEYDVKNPEVKSTSIGNGCLPFWDALVDAVEEIGMKVNCVVCPGATDARFVRQQGVPAINFTALSSTPVLLHCRDERIHIREYFKGIKTMERVISAVANVSRTVDH